MRETQGRSRFKMKLSMFVLLFMLEAISGQTNGLLEANGPTVDNGPQEAPSQATGLQEVFSCRAMLGEVDETPELGPQNSRPSQHRVLLITPQNEYLYDRSIFSHFGYPSI